MQRFLMPFIRNLSFVNQGDEKMSKKDLLDVCKCLKYEFKEAGSTVFRQGDENKGLKSIDDKFYIIMKGKVQVSIAKTEIKFFEESEENFMKTPMSEDETEKGPSQLNTIPEKRLGLKRQIEQKKCRLTDMPGIKNKLDTRLMLNDFLRHTKPKRKTRSPADVLHL